MLDPELSGGDGVSVNFAFQACTENHPIIHKNLALEVPCVWDYLLGLPVSQFWS